MKHVPFQSIYRVDFEVVEEREGRTTFYPHRSQLPLLLRALNLEFYGALPGRIGRVDVRADVINKIVLRRTALMFCSSVNGARTDQLRLFALLNPDFVTKVAIVQQITEHTHRGDCHRFCFYAGADFFPEIRLSGRRVVFADHVLQRFSTRVPNNVGTDLSMLLLTFFGSPCLALPVGPGRAFIFPYQDSLLAFPFHESETEYFITTCLTINEMNSFSRELPPQALNPHYGNTFTRPQIRHWLPTKWMMDFHESWERKIPLPPPREELPKRFNWHWVANWYPGHIRDSGHGPGSRLLFMDHVPGPCCLEFLPDQAEPRVNELEIYKQTIPDRDWSPVFAQR